MGQELGLRDWQSHSKVYMRFRCVCVCACACVRACVRACMRACGTGRRGGVVQAGQSVPGEAGQLRACRGCFRF